MAEFGGAFLMAIAVVLAAAWGGFILWRRGKFARIGLAPKPPEAGPK